MKKTIQSPLLLAMLFIFTFLFSSFSVDYSRVDSRDDDPPVTQKENRRKLRLEKRQARLQKLLKKSKHTIVRQKIQKKIRGIEKQKDDGFGTPAVGIVGMVLSILSFILFIAFIASLFTAAAAGVMIGMATFACLFGGIGLALAGLIVSIIAIVLNRKNPDKHTMKGFGIAGMIVGSVMTGIFIVTTLLFFALL
jgi:hypothetical protein